MNTVLKPEASLRPMQAADLDAVSRIEPTIFPYPWTRGNFNDSLNSGHSCWVYECEGELLGYAVMMLVLDEAHLLNISIAAPWQGKGYGRTLLAHMMDTGRQHGALNMFLEVRPSNQAALSLYESMGFNEMAIRRGYYPAPDGREDAVLMGAAL
ncbi:[SSU ribosomal protein S18P]-alanine acetyltransferase [Methylobacillus rhizosphaerae]|uniref:[Ribosomal protein bS18]-alanine N-acetyltransferase n=1 Tax=Methylobacillus rhizosphaerae TaxID=551994 RepID=A0A239A002_9PROT|nr:ribosomal protein S18-alanine N-acetyltransferase [Methylobacillus rhizosphaerae]SNR89006.1 [SSU ribosomal protein S18P]-alanine acetyltransferase [Methylobacillus rhizosphaerae]